MDDKELYKPFPSKLKGKKMSVYVMKNGKKKLIHFGDSNYTHNQNPEQRRRYLARATKIRDKHGNLTKDNKDSANYWALRVLWNYMGGV